MRRRPRAAAATLAAVGLALSGCGDRAGSGGEETGGPDAARAAAASREVPPRGARDRIVRVVDGDTVRLRSLGRTRLIGIDTPEVFFGRECFGRAASNFTRRLLPPGTKVRRDFDVERRDRYGRALVYLWRERRGVFVNAAIVRAGYGVPLTIPPNVRHADLFVRLAREAREAERGLWSPRTCGGDPDRRVR